MSKDTGLLAYEKQHNAFLRELSLALKNLASSLSPDDVLIVPQNVSIESLIMSREFAEAHTARVNPMAPYQMCSLDGRRMLLSDDRRVLSVLPGEASKSLAGVSQSNLAAFWDRESGVFDQERRAILLKTSKSESYVILREGSVDLGVFGGKGAIPVLLVSHPLRPRGPAKQWPSHPATLGFDMSVDPFLAMSPLQGSSPREVHAESEDEVVDRIQSAFSIASSAGLPKVVASQPPQTLDWIFEMGAVNSNKPPVFASSSPVVSAPISQSSPLFSTRPPPPPSAPVAATSAPQQVEKAVANEAKRKQEQEERDRREKLKQAFFDKMKNRKAADLVQGIKTFATQFLEKPPADSDKKSEVVRNFLQVLEDKIRHHSVWQGASEEELEEMSETLERFVVSKIYRVIFAPAASDLERDEKLSQRIQLLRSWLEPRHLDINIDLTSKRSMKVLELAVEQLSKWNTFKAPRDKMVCILNACKAVWKLLGAKTNGKAAGADDFLPHLIYTVIRANPPNLYSTVEYISRYRHPDKMAQEFGYYFTQLASVVPFLEGLTHKSLSVTEEVFNQRMQIVSKDKKSSMGSLPMAEKPAASMQRAVSMSALLDQPALTSAPVQKKPANVVSNAVSNVVANAPPPPPPPPSMLKFVGRDLNSMTIAEIKEMFAAYEYLAKPFI